MLTRTALHHQEPALCIPIWCEAAAHASGRTFYLGANPALTPRLALRWLRSRAEDVADQLDAPTAHPIRAWLHDEHEHERVLHRLAHGKPYTLTTCEDTSRYVLTARPFR